MFTKDVKEIKLHPPIVRYLRKNISAWRYPEGSKYPWRKTRSRFHGLAVEILLQRTKAEQVIPVYRDFVKAFPTLRRLAESPARKIKQIISPLGLSWRAKKLKELGRSIVIKNKGLIPSEYEQLLELPGVGPYAASAFISLHNNRKATIIDSNIIRLYGRFFGFQIHPEIRRNTHLIRLLQRITPADNPRGFNYSVLDLSRIICGVKPRCEICPLYRKCHFYKVERDMNGKNI